MTETIEYDVVKAIENIEIRRYPPIILATVRSPYDDAAFSILFDYISGNNGSRERISMSSPVVSRRSGARIDMTAPVISDEATFSFVLPTGLNMDTAPRPSDPRIELVPVPSRYVAALRFSGRTHLREVMERERELLSWLNKLSIRTKGAPFLMRYNNPFTPGFLRRNEVGVEVSGEDLSGGTDG